jgi:hypothetical protein
MQLTNKDWMRLRILASLPFLNRGTAQVRLSNGEYHD